MSRRSIPVVVFSIYLFFKPLNVFAYHPFYVSVTEMSLNAKTRSLEISCKMFAEDVEDILKQNYKVTVDLGNSQMQEQNNRVISDYILKHLSLSIDSRRPALKFVGFEKEAESVYCYFEVKDVRTFKKLTVNNTILQDYKQEQINIMHVVENGTRKSTKLDYPSSRASFSF